MLVLGIDLGTSSVKVSVLDTSLQQIVASAQYPSSEAEILTPSPTWAEQDPERWWEHVKQAIIACHARGGYHPKDIGAIGIAYQMHGLVLLDRQHRLLRNAIIWCDSRAVDRGDKAFRDLGKEWCLQHLLNSPGNFTASKLAWIKENEPRIYEQVGKFLLPGDYISFRLTGEAHTTVAALSEGIFWDFSNDQVSPKLMSYYGFDKDIVPGIKPLFSVHGELHAEAAAQLSMREGTPVTYKAGDQPNNALALNVLRPGEVAATAGTSGVIYGVTHELRSDPQSRVNGFAHVNHTRHDPRIGILLCINGAGIFNRWLLQMAGPGMSYGKLNALAAEIPEGGSGIVALPFGNGAERIFNNKVIGAHLHDLDFNIHSIGHLARAVQEGIAFAFRYGMEIMRENGVRPLVVRAAKTNLFLSDVFTQAFAGINDVSVEFYEGDGSYGAALGAAIGAGIYPDAEAAASHRKLLALIEPRPSSGLEGQYERWKERLREHLHSREQPNALSLIL